MGLGILFIGYFTATIAAFPFPELGLFLGHLLMSYALTKLCAYERRFLYARVLSMLTAIIAIPGVAIYLGGLFGHEIEFLSFFTSSIFGYIKTGLDLAFHVALYLGMVCLATITEVEKIRISAARNLFFYCLVVVAQVGFRILALFGEAFKEFAGIGYNVSALVYIVVLILNHVMLFSSYMWICDESDRNMDIKETGIGWYDKLRKDTAEREQKAADDTKAYLQNRYDEKATKREQSSRNQKNHSNKKKKKK